MLYQLFSSFLRGASCPKSPRAPPLPATLFMRLTARYVKVENFERSGISDKRAYQQASPSGDRIWPRGPHECQELFLALLLFDWNTALHAQNPATCFSATWRLNLEKSKLQKGTTMQSQTVTITCSRESIQMQYISDGKESKGTYTTSWEGKKDQ